MTAFRIGERVTVRYRLPDGRATDVIGWVEAANSEDVVIRRVEQPTRTIRRELIIAVRELPPARQGRSPMRDSADTVMNVTRTTTSLRVGEWFNSSTSPTRWIAVGDPGRSLSAALTLISSSNPESPVSVLTVAGTSIGEEIAGEGWIEAPALSLAVYVARLNDFLRNRDGAINTDPPHGWDVAEAGDWLVLERQLETAAAPEGWDVSSLAIFAWSAARHGVSNMAVILPATDAVAASTFSGAGFVLHHRLTGFVHQGTEKLHADDFILGFEEHND